MMEDEPIEETVGQRIAREWAIEKAKPKVWEPGSYVPRDPCLRHQQTGVYCPFHDPENQKRKPK